MAAPTNRFEIVVPMGLGNFVLAIYVTNGELTAYHFERAIDYLHMAQEDVGFIREEIVKPICLDGVQMPPVSTLVPGSI